VTAYLDTSALLRLILREAGALDQLRSLDRLISSELIVVEAARTIDRLRHHGARSAEEAIDRQDVINEWFEAIDLVRLRPPVLNRAREPLPAPLGTLDALHLATALPWRDRMAEPVVMATHGQALALAARAFGFEVVAT